MNKAALTKHEIYNKLFEFTEHDLDAVANFIDFMRHKRKLEAKKVINNRSHQAFQSADKGESTIHQTFL